MLQPSEQNVQAEELSCLVGTCSWAEKQKHVILMRFHTLKCEQ